MARPSFQFYPGDWRNNAKLRRCSEAARGVWIDVLCVLHDSDEYGVARFSLAELARASGNSLKFLKELVQKGVLKGCDKNTEDFVHFPRSGNRQGDPVILVVANGGPCWYCSRFVRDEWVSSRRGAGTRFVSEPLPKAENCPAEYSQNEVPSRIPTQRVSTGSMSSSSSSSSFKAAAAAREAWPDGPDPTAAVGSAIDECLGIWPVPTLRQFSIRDAELEASKFPDPAAWAEKLADRCRIWANYYRGKKASDPKLRIPGLGFWISDGQYSREPPRDFQTLEETVADDVARFRARRGVAQ